MTKGNRIIVFDTTLRDGEQTPGVGLNIDEKIEIAGVLKDLGVDYIEAGFPITSRGDFEAVSMISKKIKGIGIAGLARALKKDIDVCWEAIKYSSHPRIHTFIATSPVHMKYKLKMSEDKVLETAVNAVRYARRFTSDVEFSCEDATRSEKNFLLKVINAVIKAGAKTINIPDTVGYTVPQEFSDLISFLKEKVGDKVIFSVHCHNDLGLAVANSLSAVLAGARQVECTINGLGERAGNASLEEFVMTLKARRKYFNLFTNINTRKIIKASRTVARLTGITPQPNKAIVGANAFAHESGIHQDGVIKKRTTYEIINPKDIGLKESKLVLGKHSGRHAIKKKLEDLGYNLKEEEIDKIFFKFKDLADKKEKIYDEDLLVLIEDSIPKYVEILKLISFQVSTGNKMKPFALVKVIKKDGKKEIEYEGVGLGDGPVDATLKAIDNITGVKGKLIDYKIQSVSSGKDAIGEVWVKVRFNGKSYLGKGISTDIIEASILAYIDGLNKYFNVKK